MFLKSSAVKRTILGTEKNLVLEYILFLPFYMVGVFVYIIHETFSKRITKDTTLTSELLHYCKDDTNGSKRP